MAISTDNMDADTDSATAARQQILQAVQMVNATSHQQTVDSLSALRLVSKLVHQHVTVSGYGLYVYDAADSTSADNGLTVIVGADGGRWKSAAGDIGPVLTATEGVTFAGGYLSRAFGHMDVPSTNTGNVRYWVANYTLKIPSGATIPAGDVRHDHAAVAGRVMSEALNTRAWGGVFLYHNTSAATNNTQAGQGLATEFDVNWSPSTGYNLNNLAGDGDVGAVLIASGSTSIPKFAQCISKLGNTSIKGFFVGRWVREQSIDSSGFVDYIGNVSPSYGYYFAPDYTGGPALSTPAGLDALSMRTTSGPAARIRSNADRLEMSCGNGGYSLSNAANDTVLVAVSNAGSMGVGCASGTERVKVQPANNGTSRALMLMTGGGDVGAYSAYGSIASAAGESSSDAILYLRKASGNNRSLNAAGTLNASGADYAEYMTKRADCGVVAPGQIVGVDASGLLTDRYADAVSFVVKSTAPCLVGGDTWSDHLVAPVAPQFVPPDYAGRAQPGAGPQVTARRPRPLPEDPTASDIARHDAELQAYMVDVARVAAETPAWQEACAQWDADQQAHEQAVNTARAAFEAGPLADFLAAAAQHAAALEVARAAVDRIAYCGQVPVNVLGATPGDYIVPAPTAAGGITGQPVGAAGVTWQQYLRSVGIVQSIAPDGRAVIRVRTA